VDPKNDFFFQKSGACLIYCESANPPRFQRNRQELAHNPKYTSDGCRNEMRTDMHIRGGLLFIWGAMTSFQFFFSVVASQKKPDFGTLKMEKALFMGRNENQPLWRSSSS
jgi:hypothetical protein